MKKLVQTLIIIGFAFSSQAGMIEMNRVDLESVLLEDSNRQPGQAERYAYAHDVDINFFDVATSETLENGNTLWRLRLKSESAIGMKVYFNEFYLPNLSSLSIFNDDRSMVDGPFNSDNNHIDGKFGHALLKGEYLILEYTEPQSSNEEARLNISTIYHAYKDILGFYNNESERNCGINVACDEGEFSDQIKSVIFLDMNGYICSAVLINNTSYDLTPYVLTANHCVDSESPGDHNYFTFYFNHQSSGCNNSNSYYNNYRTGSTLRSSYYYSDFALLEMDYTPASSFNAYYAGWDKSSSNPQVSTGIHHPGGAPKKINYDNNDTAYNDGWYSSNTHWRLSWDSGGTEGGSSGSPLFNDEKLIVGQLHGGTGECGNGNDLYGKISRSWTGGGSSTTRLSDWLDPLGTNQESISGTFNGEGGGNPPEPHQITLISPNGGESLQAGQSYTITWEDNFDDNISIKLYKGGVFATTISSTTESDGQYSWNIPSNIEERTDYKIKITDLSDSNTFAYSDNNFSIYSPGTASISISDYSYSGNSGSIKVDLQNDVPIAGYQFVVEDSPNNINITSVEDLTESDFSVSTNTDGQVIAFSFSGGTIDEGSQSLVSINFDIINYEETTLCLNQPVFSSSNANAVAVDVGSCVTLELNQGIAGDINFDQVTNVLDVVILVNIILDSSSISDSELVAGDMNQDGILNVLDIVQLVNIILS